MTVYACIRSLISIFYSAKQYTLLQSALYDI